MDALIATDLDRTMIYSERAAGTHTGPLVCVEYYQGGPLTFMTERAVAQLTALAARAVVVPTTTRTIAQYSRISLPGAPFRYAINANGGNIIVDGTPDPQWRARVEAEIAANSIPLHQISSEIESRLDESWVTLVRSPEELFHYIVVCPELVPDGFLADWTAWCRDRGWMVSQQGRKIYTTPLTLCKSRAVAEVRARLLADGTLDEQAAVLAAGDGALDAEMLMAADRAIRPRHGELEQLDFRHPRLTVTTASEIGASEEILDWFAAQSLAADRQSV